MKKQYKSPILVFTNPSFDVELMVPITPSHGAAPGGLGKERDDFEEYDDDDEFINELQEMEQSDKPLW